jgi:hypothetical protein
MALLCLVGCKREQPTATGGTNTSTSGKILTLSPVENTRVVIGDTVKFDVKIKRVGFDDPVVIDFTGLPEGVAIVEKDRTIAKDADKITLTLKAETTAKPTKGAIVVFTAKAGAVEAAAREFKLDVDESNVQKIADLLQEMGLHKVDLAIEALKKKALAAQGDEKAALDKELAKVEQARQSLQKLLDSAKSKTPEQWFLHTSTILSSFIELKNAVKQAQAVVPTPRLDLVTPKTAKVTAGETSKLEIKIERQGFDDPVTIDIEDLPPGVSVVEKDKIIAKGADNLALTLKAEATAKPVKGAIVKITAKGGKAQPITVQLKLDVEPGIAALADELLKTVQVKLTETDDRIAKLKVGPKDEKDEVRVAREKEAAKLQELRVTVQKQLDAGKVQTPEGWEAYAKGVRGAIDQLHDAVKKAHEKYLK